MHLLRVALRVEAEVPQAAAKRSHHARSVCVCVCEFRVKKPHQSKRRGGVWVRFKLGP